MSEKYEVIKFVDNEFELDVNVDYNEDTIWLTQKQLAIIFNVNSQAITKQLKKLYEDDELNFSSTCSILEQVQIEGERKIVRKVKIYNMDVLIFLGFKMKSHRALQFRKWANKVLKKYLLKGYVINENRVIVSNENFNDLLTVVNHIQSNQININDRLTKVEDEILKKEYGLDKIFFNGEFYDAYTLVQSIFEKANNEIIIIDNYVNRTILDRLVVKKRNVNVLIYTDIRTSRLLGQDINTYNTQYGNLIVNYTNKVHDRYIIIDRSKIYHLGASIKDLGKKIFSISESDSNLIVELLNNL